MAKLKISEFVAFLVACAARTDGYLMGARGQYSSKLTASSWLIAQYKSIAAQHQKALHWLKHALRNWDCQGLAEGYVNDKTGSNIDVRARNNYASWCDPKGTGTIPKQYRVPGAAVFIHSASSGAITHVGYLVRPVVAGKPDGDWYVVEARGVMYGVVTTKLNSRGWNRWGLMTKYFDYGAEPTVWNLGDRELRKGVTGDDVKQLQGMLIEAGYDCGRWGADGEFGSATKAAVEAFQTTAGLKVDGAVDEDDVHALKALVVDDPDPVEPEAPPVPRGNVVIEGGQAHIRTGPGTQYASAGVAKPGERYELIEAIGWVPVLVGGEVRYVSAKFAKVMEG